MPGTTSLRVLDAATALAVAVDRLIERTPLAEAAQLRSAANSIGANIAEGYGRGRGQDRVRFFRIARGSTEETIQHLRLNHRTGRIGDRDFFVLFNLAIAIVRMLDALIERELGDKDRSTARSAPTPTRRLD